MFSLPDKNGIINGLPGGLLRTNKARSKSFSAFAFIYDVMMEFVTRPRIHKADPRRHRELLAGLISPVKDARVLEVACGTGGAIPYFHGSNDYTGLDISYAMLKRAVKKAKKHPFNTCRFIHGNAEELIFENDSFVFVLMDTALHMIPDYQAAIIEIARVLVQDGIFVCTTPVVGINREFDTTWAKMSAKRSLHSLTVPNVEKLCKQAGLQFRQYETNGGMLYFRAVKI